MRRHALVLLVAFACGCSKQRNAQPGPLSVAAAANLADAFGAISKAFTEQTQITVTLTFGSTAQLAQQIDNGAPFDVFAAADSTHVDSLVSKGRIEKDSRRIYARGRLALWAPNWDPATLSPESLQDARIRFVAVAQPSSAPYGQAAVDALQQLNLWPAVEPKIVYANNIQMAKQFVKSGNADAAFTAFSLLTGEKGVVKVDAKLHAPLDQAAGVISGSRKREEAQRFLDFVTSSPGRTILQKYGYEFP